MSQDNGAHGQTGATNESNNAYDGLAVNPSASTDATLNARAKRKGGRGPAGWVWALITVIVAAALVLGAWLAVGRSDGKNDTQTDLHTAKTDTITIGLKLAPVNLDIRTQSGNALMQLLIGNVYEGIVGRDSSNQVTPAIADSWEQSDDGLTYTFHIAKGLEFSNGDTLDAEDAAWSIQQMLEKKYYDYEQLGDVASVKATDASTLVITLAKPNANFLWYLSARPGLVFDKDASYDPKTEAVGSGPYTIEKFVPNDSVTLKANENYEGRNKPKTKTVVVRYLTDENAAVNALKSGDVQVLSPINENLAKPLEDDPNYVIKAGDGSDKYVLAFNNKRAPFTDKRVRQAIRYAIDHEQIIASRGGADKALGGPIPPVDPGYEDLTDLYPHDVKKAQSLMKEAGYSADKPLKVTLTYANTYGTELGDQLRSQLKDVYIDLSINYVEFSTWLQDVHKNADYDLSLVDHAESHDFEQWADPTYYYGYDNPEVQDLYAKAMAATSQDECDKLLAKAARLVSEDAAADWLFSYRITTATVKGVEGFPFDLSQTVLPLWNVTYTK